MYAFSLREIDREGPQSEDRQRLIGPPEILPYRIEAIGVLDLPDQQSERDGKDGHADIDAIDLLALTQTEGLGDDQAGRPKGRISRRDRGCHHTKHGKDASHDAKPVATDEVHHHGAEVWSRVAEASPICS